MNNTENRHLNNAIQKQELPSAKPDSNASTDDNQPLQPIIQFKTFSDESARKKEKGDD